MTSEKIWSDLLTFELDLILVVLVLETRLTSWAINVEELMLK